MKVKRSLEKRVNGWLPKEPNFPTKKITTNIKIKNQRPTYTRKERLAVGLVSGLGAIGSILLLIVILEHFLTPYNDPSMITKLILGISFIVAATSVLILEQISEKRKQMPLINIMN
jgi:predicted membrane channel-forming protein YqfA (hemolysin III family)